MRMHNYCHQVCINTHVFLIVAWSYDPEILAWVVSKNGCVQYAAYIIPTALQWFCTEGSLVLFMFNSAYFWFLAEKIAGKKFTWILLCILPIILAVILYYCVH